MSTMKKTKNKHTKSHQPSDTIARHYYNLGISDDGSLQDIIAELLERGHPVEQIMQWTDISESEIISQEST